MMYQMNVLGDEDLLVATQRYYNLVKSILEYSDNSKGVTVTVVLGDVNLSWGIRVDSSDDRLPDMLVSFVFEDYEFYVNESVYSNNQWLTWVESQPVRAVTYDRVRLLEEVIEFALDYYSDFSYEYERA